MGRHYGGKGWVRPLRESHDRKLNELWDRSCGLDGFGDEGGHFQTSVEAHTYTRTRGGTIVERCFLFGAFNGKMYLGSVTCDRGIQDIKETSIQIQITILPLSTYPALLYG